MKKIGISASNISSQAFKFARISGYNIDAVRRAGGLAIMIPSAKDPSLAGDYIDNIDALILTGGNDVAPFSYGKNPNTEEKYDFERDRFEISLFKKAMDKKIPILSLCRGLQVANVARGGTNIRDLKKAGYDQVLHSVEGANWHEPTDLYHLVSVSKDSQFYRINKEDQVLANSLHHQAIDELGENMLAVGRSEDGVIEIVEMSDYEDFIGFQFHPERLQDQEVFTRLYDELIRRA